MKRYIILRVSLEPKLNRFMSSNKIDSLRSKLDELDEEIISIIAERRTVSRQIAAVKEAEHLPLRDITRERSILNQRASSAGKRGLNPLLVRRIFRDIVEESTRGVPLTNHTSSPKSESVNEETKGKSLYSLVKGYLNQGRENGTTEEAELFTELQKHGYLLASRSIKHDNTIVRVGDVQIGGDEFIVIAGPCAVESREQVHVCAEVSKHLGASLLRGGCFKSRTSPYSFQGLGYEGLEYLVSAGRKYKLPVVTEVLSPEDVEKVGLEADLLQIGARNMQNFPLLKEVGKSVRPVMLKRGMSSSIKEVLQAVEYILSHGNENVIICERGIRTFETSTRNTLDLSAVPVLKRESHLPVIVDPSHAAGQSDLVVPLALAAKAVGADGVMVEIHPEPSKALSDGPQALTFDAFEDLMRQLAVIPNRKEREGLLDVSRIATKASGAS